MKFPQFQQLNKFNSQNNIQTKLTDSNLTALSITSNNFQTNNFMDWWPSKQQDIEQILELHFHRQIFKEDISTHTFNWLPK